MLKEIYCKNNSDPYYNPFALEITNELEAVLTKIRMILFTSKGEVLGEPELGMNLENMIFEKSVNSNEIEREFYRQISLFVPEAGLNYDIKLEVNFVPGTIRDLCYLDIYVNGNKYLGVFVS